MHFLFLFCLSLCRLVYVVVGDFESKMKSVEPVQSAEHSSQCASPVVTRARLYVSLFACTKEALCPIAPLIVQLRCCDTGAVVGRLLKTSHFSAHDPGMGTNRFVSYSEMSLMDVLHHVSTHVLSDYDRPHHKTSLYFLLKSPFPV